MLTHKLLALSLVGTEWIIWALLGLSVFSLGIIIERVMVLKKKRGNLEQLKHKLNKKRDHVTVEHILQEDGSAAAKVTLGIIQNMKDMGVGFEDGLSIALTEEKVSLEKRITILGTLGSNAPFIGLFGTVLGIIHAFHSLALNAKGGPSVVMAGISEALVATALGLFVAIPAVAAYNYFVRSIKKIIVSSENFARLVTFNYIKAAAKKD